MKNGQKFTGTIIWQAAGDHETLHSTRCCLSLDRIHMGKILYRIGVGEYGNRG